MIVGLRNNLRRDEELEFALRACTRGGAALMGITDYGLEVGAQEAAGAFGVLRVNAIGQVTGFDEKPERPACVPGRDGQALVSLGIYGADLDLLVGDGAAVTEGGLEGVAANGGFGLLVGLRADQGLLLAVDESVNEVYHHCDADRQSRQVLSVLSARSYAQVRALRSILTAGLFVDIFRRTPGLPLSHARTSPASQRQVDVMNPALLRMPVIRGGGNPITSMSGLRSVDFTPTHSNTSARVMMARSETVLDHCGGSCMMILRSRPPRGSRKRCRWRRR